MAGVIREQLMGFGDPKWEIQREGKGGRVFLFATHGYTPKFISEKPQLAPRPHHHEPGRMGGKPQHHSDPPFLRARRDNSSELKSRQGARPPERFDVHTNGTIRKTRESYAPALDIGLWRRGVDLAGQIDSSTLPGTKMTRAFQPFDDQVNRGIPRLKRS